MYKPNNKITTALLALTSGLMLISSHAFAKTAEQHLAITDSYRYQTGSIKTVTYVKQFKEGELKKDSQYSVYSKTGVGSLVVFKSAAENGQKMLMQNDKYWMFMPKSRRPIRITPMQKLLGEASVGDISSLSWYESYQPTLIESDPELTKAETLRLELNAKIEGLSYQKIDLIISRKDSFPIRADLYLKSGKLTKTAWFTKGLLNNEVAVTKMRLNDSIQTGQETIIEYQSQEFMALPDKIFNPSYLVRNNPIDY